MRTSIQRIFLFIVETLFVENLMAQHIDGSVLDGTFDNEPLPGANISVDGKLLTHTNVDGKFSVDLPRGTKKFTVSYIGFASQEVTLKNGKKNYEIVLLADSKEMQELVVTGYQQIDRRQMTGSFTTVKIDEETVGAIKNVDQALAGQVAGLSSVASTGAPGAPLKIRIRGTASISGSQDPLWVLDGIPIEGTDIPSMEDLKDIDNLYQTSIAGLNPQDIESITVLKDAAATAIYGARAANGVIVITTKKGKSGAPDIHFNAKLTCSPKTSLDRLNLLNSKEKTDLELELLQSGYAYRENKGDVSRILSSLGEIDTYKSGGWNALSSTAKQRIDNLRNTNLDWNDILMRTALTQEYGFSIGGGGERANYYTSIGYYDQQGNVKGVDANRFNMTLKTQYQVNKRLKLGASLFANQRKQNSFMTDYNGFVNPVYYSRLANPYFQPFLNDGTYNYDVNVQGGKEDSELNFNIFEERRNTTHKRRDQQVMALLDGELKLTDWLKANSQLGLQVDGSTIDKYAGENSFSMRKDMERSLYSSSNGPMASLPIGGKHQVTESHDFQWTWKAMLEANKQFKEIHNLQMMLGTEVRHYDYNSLYSAAYGYDRRTLTSQTVYFPSENFADLFPLHQESETENAFVSWFATGGYTLLSRYTLGGSIRFDGSDVFGVAKKYRYLPLYSVSGLWRIGEEKWMQNAKWIDNFNLRASYGIQGNIDKNTSPYLIGTYDQKSILGKSEYVIDAETAPNPSLRWEKTQNVNVGLDLAVLNNALTLGVDYYFRHSSDLIGMKMLPLETGFSSTTINWATMENKGWEFALGTRNIWKKNIHWTTNLNIGLNKNKVLRETVAENSTYPSREGYPVGAIFALKTAGLDQEGYPLFQSEDGSTTTLTDLLQLNYYGASTLSAEQQRNLFKYVGTEDPKVSGGFINTFDIYDFQLGLNFTFNLGMKVRTTPSYSNTTFDRGLNTNHDIFKRWSVNNPSGTMPSLINENDRPAEYVQYHDLNLYNYLDLWVRNCNYIRLQSLRLAYKLHGTWMKKIGVKNASASIEGRNLFVIASNYQNYLDPETMGNPYAQPIAKEIIFGVNVGF